VKKIILLLLLLLVCGCVARLSAEKLDASAEISDVRGVK